MVPLSAPGGAAFSAGVIGRKDVKSMRSMCNNSRGGESLIWVGYHNLGQLLAPKRIELENPAMSQIEDSSKAFPTVI